MAHQVDELNTKLDDLKSRVEEIMTELEAFRNAHQGSDLQQFIDKVDAIRARLG
jgi:archaellum component FlaC